ncbi:hypothetical protein JCM3765_006806 [Sporobolomyces pararoseus]
MSDSTPTDQAKLQEKPDPILLSLFANRFMSIAEAQGRALEKTSISTNIKERLDYSCAIFAPTGDLIANAPHLPVHLGSMSFAVRYQVNLLKGNLQPGDVLLTNHPVAGGSHLPDITAITPVFDNDKIIFFVASRGHHADIGGITAGSMPPNSKTIFEEGASIVSFKIVEKGKYQRDELLRYLVDEPAKYPGCSGTRCLSDVESDLKAQISANQKGASLIRQLIQEYSLETVQKYMLWIRDNAELAVRNLLKRVAAAQGTNKLHAIDHLDDGTPIELSVTIDAEQGSAIFDFEGTGPEIYGNLNAPASVVYSMIIYALRAMVNEKIPLNQGCLVPIDVRIPKGSCLDPSDSAAVVGGNVCTSQRITDVILKAFKAAAASQGCCNNCERTIAGGSGAGPHWHGTSGIHVHATNTKITDPEILERRYPAILHKFTCREGSGGEGKYRGGNGVVREIEFTEPVQCSILSERRVYRPYGLEGGGNGQVGRNIWVKRPRKEDGDLPQDVKEEDAPPRRVYLGGKATVKMGKGDRIVIETPGGGGWGNESTEVSEEQTKEETKKATPTFKGIMGSLAEKAAAQLGV